VTEFVQDPDFTLLVGDNREELSLLEEGSVDCCVTSPPYYGLREYDAPPSVWGGNPDCEHEWALERRVDTRGQDGSTLTGQRYQGASRFEVSAGTCVRCGAWLGQLGHEPTPDLYVEHLVAVFQAVRRVLADHGTVWLNIADSYTSGGRAWREEDEGGPKGRGSYTRPMTPEGLKPKELILVPERLRLALQADGWYVRSVVIWDKPNAMPESVLDRPTSAHEDLIMLTKSVRYFYDPFGYREPASWERWGAQTNGKYEGAGSKAAAAAEASVEEMKLDERRAAGKNSRSVWRIPTESYPGAHYAVFPRELPRRAILLGCPSEVCVTCGRPRYRLTGRPCRECGELVPTQAKECGACGFRNVAWREERDANPELVVDESGSTPGRHVPRRRDIAPRLVDMGLSECGCGAGLEPDALEVIYTPTGGRAGPDETLLTGRKGLGRPRSQGEGRRPITRFEQRAYAAQFKAAPQRAQMEQEAGRETFAHYLRTDRAGARPPRPDLLEAWIERGWVERVEVPEVPPGSYRPGVVLDPFLGSGTAALVAREEGRHSIGVERSESYAGQAAERLSQLSLMAR
jgi:DNA modification methylase